jgi:hypothetical protein
MILRVRRNEVFKVKGLDLSLVGFRETLALVDELERVLNAAQHGTDEPGKPPLEEAAAQHLKESLHGAEPSTPMPPRYVTEYTHHLLCNGCTLQTVRRSAQRTRRA